MTLVPRDVGVMKQDVSINRISNKYSLICVLFLERKEYIYIYIYIYTYTHAHTYMHICITYIFQEEIITIIYMYMCVCVCVYVRLYTSWYGILIYIYIDISNTYLQKCFILHHTLTDTHTHTHTHLFTRFDLFFNATHWSTTVPHKLLLPLSEVKQYILPYTVRSPERYLTPLRPRRSYKIPWLRNGNFHIQPHDLTTTR